MTSTSVNIQALRSTRQPRYRKEPSKLAIAQDARIDQFSRRKHGLHKKPSKRQVICKWIITFIFGCVLVGCTVTSKISIIALGGSLNDNKNPEVFVMLIWVLLIPNIIGCFRSSWKIIGKNDLPWPKGGAISLSIVLSTLEVSGLTLLVMKGFQSLAITSVLLMESTLMLPILSLIRQAYREKKTIRFFVAGILSVVGTVLSMITLFNRSSDSENYLIGLGVLMISIAWIPGLQKKTMVKNDQYISLENMPARQTSIRMQHLPSGRLNLDTSTSPENNLHWTILFIQSSVKLIITIPVVFLFRFVVLSGGGDISQSIDGWTGWTSGTELSLFIINISTSILGYITGVFACHTCMDRGAFTIPLSLTTPIATVITMIPSFCKVMESENCGEEFLPLAVAAAICFALSHFLSIGLTILQRSSIVLEQETKLFWFASYNGILLEQWMFINKKSLDLDSHTATTSGRRSSKVFICTTMYNENQIEMRQLLESIYSINLAYISSDQNKLCHFESHVFLDGAIKDEDLQENALQLFGLLTESFGIKDLRYGTKTMTPYGMRMSWKLPGLQGQEGIIFTIHLKDNKKVKNKKRWSQIMYMSYVLDYLNTNVQIGEGNDDEENDCFILATDADVQFRASDVEALLDLMTRDQTVGAVCARTYPMGGGPLVWYQKFEYAIGHWFQKAAEHVLGSVLCAPGCFSVYRCSALRTVVSIYASEVKKANEFLIKDMGEDRWLCTLLVQSGWRIEYCAASENHTFCPEEFDEFYKQRRRWIVSTLANIWKLIAEWRFIRGMNHRIPVLFCLYQIFLFASTIVGPSTIIMVVSGGLAYAWGINIVATFVLQIIICVLFSIVCLKMKSDKQLLIAKILTFVYGVVMTGVSVGIAIQIASDFENTGKDSDESDAPPEKPAEGISIEIPYSVTTVYLSSLSTIFILTGVFHLKEIVNLLYGIIYLLSLPSCYLILLIYCICNITDRSWGTRDKGPSNNQALVTDDWFRSFRNFIQKIFFCCFRQSQQDTNANNMNNGSTNKEDAAVGNEQEASEVWMPEGEIDKTGLNTSLLHKHSATGQNIQSVKEWLHDDNMIQLYCDKFQEHGYDNTIFLSGMTEKTLEKKIGVDSHVHRSHLMSKIQQLPPADIDVQVPTDVNKWLDDIGLRMYKKDFQKAAITTPEGLEILKDMNQKKISKEIGIQKHGHLTRLLKAIDKLRYPTDEDKLHRYVRSIISQTDTKHLKDVNKTEYEFWTELVEICLRPSRDAFVQQHELKKGLETLRLSALMGGWAVNILWLVLAMTLSASASLTTAGTNPLGLVFIVVFGIIFVIQFFCMIVHRFQTLSHFIARLPYKTTGSFHSSWSFGQSDKNHLDEEEWRAFNRALQCSSERLSPIHESSPATSSRENANDMTPLMLNRSERPSYSGNS